MHFVLCILIVCPITCAAFVNFVIVSFDAPLRISLQLLHHLRKQVSEYFYYFEQLHVKIY